MKERLFKTLKKYAAVIGIGVFYLGFTVCTGWGIPCFFYELTRLKCPACGVSRMALALIRLDFAVAFSYNPFLFITAPIILFCLVYSDVRYVRTGDMSLGKVGVLLWAEIVFAVAFGILRNIL